ncbi:Dabb family protein [Halalkalibacter lacteus]|uniref:Dabb family protein n=1 Tax=Halalkalibacter lacteus TaxID=3090663 RepID=UPI002FCA55F8
MIEHLVLFQFNDSITPEKEEELVQKLLSFKGQIPGLVEVTAGLNVTEEVDKE